MCVCAPPLSSVSSLSLPPQPAPHNRVKCLNFDLRKEGGSVLAHKHVRGTANWRQQAQRPAKDSHAMNEEAEVEGGRRVTGSVVNAEESRVQSAEWRVQ